MNDLHNLNAKILKAIQYLTDLSRFAQQVEGDPSDEHLQNVLITAQIIEKHIRHVFASVETLIKTASADEEDGIDVEGVVCENGIQLRG